MENRSAVGAASRSASTGSTLVALRAGATAAATVISVPTASPMATVPASTWSGAEGSENPNMPISRVSPCAMPSPSTMPSADAAAPSTAASTTMVCITWRRVAPIALSNASSRVRWATCMEKVFQMMKDPTNSAMPANPVSAMVTMPSPAVTASACSSATCCPVTASSPSGRTAPIRCASSSSDVPSAALATIES